MSPHDYFAMRWRARRQARVALQVDGRSGLNGPSRHSCSPSSAIDARAPRPPHARAVATTPLPLVAGFLEMRPPLTLFPAGAERRRCWCLLRAMIYAMGMLVRARPIASAPKMTSPGARIISTGAHAAGDAGRDYCHRPRAATGWRSRDELFTFRGLPASMNSRASGRSQPMPTGATMPPFYRRYRRKMRHEKEATMKSGLAPPRSTIFSPS